MIISNRRVLLLLLGVIMLSGCEGLLLIDTQSLLAPTLKRSEILGLIAGLGTTFAALPDLILSEAHLRRLLHSYRAYYNHSRPHQGLENNSPIPRDVQPSSHGRIHAAAEVGGLHHRDQSVA